MKRRNLVLGLLALGLPATWFRRATTPTLLNARGPKPLSVESLQEALREFERRGGTVYRV